MRGTKSIVISCPSVPNHFPLRCIFFCLSSFRFPSVRVSCHSVFIVLPHQSSSIISRSIHASLLFLLPHPILVLICIYSKANLPADVLFIITFPFGHWDCPMCKFEMGPKRGKNIKLKCKEMMRGGGKQT